MLKLNKRQKMIAIAASVLISIVYIFPPYTEPELNDKGEIAGTHVKWEFNKQFRDMLHPPVYTNPETGWSSLIIIEYARRTDLWLLEFFGIIVLAGAALVITKKQ